MVFSNSATGAGIVEDIDFICGTDSVSYPLIDKARNSNRHYWVAVSDILRTQGRTQWDDSNLTTLSELTFDLVAGQQDYSWPSGALKLDAIEIKNSNGDWVRLQEIDTDELRRTITDFEETDGMPKYYDVRGDSIFLYPAPAAASVTTTAGGKVYVAREFDALVSGDTTQEPGFAEPYHRILSLGASYDWLVVNDTDAKSNRVLQQYEMLRQSLREFYSTKNKDVRVGIRPAHRQAHYL